MSAASLAIWTTVALVTASKEIISLVSRTNPVAGKMVLTALVSASATASAFLVHRAFSMPAVKA